MSQTDPSHGTHLQHRTVALAPPRTAGGSRTVGEVNGRLIASDLDRALQQIEEAFVFLSEASTVLGSFDNAGMPRTLGHTSIERLVASRSGCGNRWAAEMMTVARHVHRFPRTGSALIDGRIKWAAAAILAQAAHGLVVKYSNDEGVLLEAASARTAEELEEVCQLWRARYTDNPNVDLDDHCCHKRYSDFDSDLNTRGGGTTAVDVIIDVETLAGADGPLDRIRSELNRGGPISGPGLDRLLCDASYRALITDGPRTLLAYNRSTPDIPPALRRAIRIRDRRCTFTGCDRPWFWCDLHHIKPRNRGGSTSADNLTLLCRFHHSAVHEGGWTLSRTPDGHIDCTSPQPPPKSRSEQHEPLRPVLQD